MHEIPEDGTKHLTTPDCPCGVTARKTDRTARTVYVHVDQQPDTADGGGQ